MGTQRTIVVVGGALAGPTAAARARETDEHARIVLLERAGAVSYAVAGLGARIAGDVKSVAELDREDARFFRELYDVEVRTGAAVSRIDADARVVHVGAEKLAWDSLIYAAGVESVMPDVDWLAGATNVHRFRNLHDLEAITASLRRSKRVAVLGGGYFGVEAADALARRGASVVVLERGERLLPQLAKGASRAARLGLEAAGAEVRCDVLVVSADVRNERVRGLRLAGGEVVGCDLVIVATGVRPRTELLREAGAKLLPNGAVVVDERCETTLADVFACGTCVAVEHAVTRRLTWSPQAAIADKTAQVAGEVAAGGGAALERMLCTSVVRAGAVTVARTGAEAADEPRALVARAHALSQDAFVPGASVVSVEMLVHPDGYLLGADAWGTSGVDKCIDVLAAHVRDGEDLRVLAQRDLAYAPGYGRARGVPNVAAAVAEASFDYRVRTWAPDELAQRLGRVDVLDVRPAAERKGGSVPGATPVDFAELRARAAQLVKTARPIVVVSSDGARAYQAALILSARGAKDAGYLSGGVLSWLGDGHALEAPNKAEPPAQTATKKAAKQRSRR